MDVKPYLCHIMDFNPDNIIFTREGESKFTLLSHKYKGKEIPILLNFRTKSLGVDKIDTKKSNCKINSMQIPNCKFKGIDEKLFCEIADSSVITMPSIFLSNNSIAVCICSRVS